MKKIAKCITALGMAGSVLCACITVTPHENFVNNVQGLVGYRIDEIGLWANPQQLVSTQNLPNGHVEYTYRALRACQYMFEVDPSTRRIVGARYEGTDEDCILIP
jgi:hypothetical protein